MVGRRTWWLLGVAVVAAVVLVVVASERRQSVAVVELGEHLPRPTVPTGPCRQVAVIGDSLTRGDAINIHARLGGAIVNARDGRTTGEAYEAALGVAQSNLVDCWVFALGTNDLGHHISSSDSRAAIAQLVTVVGPYHWIRVWWVVPSYGPGAPDYDVDAYVDLIPDTITVIDLALPDAAFTNDGVHPTLDGYRMRLEQIAATVPVYYQPSA